MFALAPAALADGSTGAGAGEVATSHAGAASDSSVRDDNRGTAPAAEPAARPAESSAPVSGNTSDEGVTVPEDTANPSSSTAESTSVDAGEPSDGQGNYMVVGAKLDWIIHQGWYDYMSNKKGGTDGVIDAGRGARHISYRKSLTWGTGVGNCTSEGTCDIAFPGVVIFKKHKQGEDYALDMRIEDLRIHTEGAQGSVIVKIRSKDMSTGEYVENPSWTMMTFTLPQAVSAGESDSLSIQITDPVFASDASRYFTMYNNEVGASMKLSATTHPDGRPDAKGIIWERVGEDHRIDFNIVQWPIIKDFFAKSKADGVRMSTSGGVQPLGESLDFSKPEARIDADTLILTYPGEIRLFKEKEGGDTETLSEIRDLQLRISANDHGEIYMTVKRWVDGQAREQLTHIGTFFGKIYYCAGELTLHVKDAAVRMDPDSTLVIPYLTNSENVAPLSFRFEVTDQNLDNREARLAVVNAFRDRQLTWLNRSPIFSTTYGEYTPVQPDQPMSVEEENAAWQDAPAPRANIGELLWGVKRSWQGYVGKGTLGDGASYSMETRNYTFPAATPTVSREDNGEVIVQYAGSVNWKAYGGILNITMADLQLHLTPRDGQDLSAGFAPDVAVYAHIGSGEALERWTRVGTIHGEVDVREDSGAVEASASTLADSAEDAEAAQPAFLASNLLRLRSVNTLSAAGSDARTGNALSGASSPSDSLVLSMENRPFYLHEDVAGVFVNVYRGGLRMDNISFAARMDSPAPSGDGGDPNATGGDNPTDVSGAPGESGGNGSGDTAVPGGTPGKQEEPAVAGGSSAPVALGEHASTAPSVGAQMGEGVDTSAQPKAEGLPATGASGLMLASACVVIAVGCAALQARRRWV